MTSIPSATTWGSPTATKHALLIHGLTSTSHTWHRVAPSLAAQGYFVTAPDLIGHASRASTGDFSLRSIAQDLHPYLEARTYSLIIGHSLGALTVLHLLSRLPTSRPTAIVLVDPPMRREPAGNEAANHYFTDTCVNVKSGDTYCAENPLWTREDGVYRELGTRLCTAEAVQGVLTQNSPWDFFELFNEVSDNVKMTVVVADPAINHLCAVKDVERYPRLRAVMVPGAGHWIQYEFPQVIVEEALKRAAELDAA